jgi:hypothetical protein
LGVGVRVRERFLPQTGAASQATEDHLDRVIARSAAIVAVSSEPPQIARYFRGKPGERLVLPAGVIASSAGHFELFSVLLDAF